MLKGHSPSLARRPSEPRIAPPSLASPLRASHRPSEPRIAPPSLASTLRASGSTLRGCRLGGALGTTLMGLKGFKMRVHDLPLRFCHELRWDSDLRSGLSAWRLRAENGGVKGGRHSCTAVRAIFALLRRAGGEATSRSSVDVVELKFWSILRLFCWNDQAILRSTALNSAVRRTRQFIFGTYVWGPLS